MEYSILDAVQDLSSYQSFTDRYFSKRYILDVDGVEYNDIMIMFHSNRIAVLSLAPSHFFFKNDKNYNISFMIGKVDRLNSSVKGKGKKGGQKLTSESVVCKIKYPDGTGFDVVCCMKGMLVEVNKELVKHPELLKEMPDSDGYIAVVLASIAISEATKTNLLTHEDYCKLRDVSVY